MRQPLSDPPVSDVLQRVIAQQAGPARVTVTDQVRETMRKAILSGDLPGGTRLALAEVADALGVSTTPVREALRVLASEGFVQLDPYRGGIVRSPQREEIEEVIRLRQALEPIAMEEAVKGMTPEILDEADRHLKMMLDRPDSDEWVEANREFHEILYRAVNSERLLEILSMLRSPVVMYVSRAVIHHADFRTTANRQHVGLMTAVKDGDWKKASEIIVDHVALPVIVAEDGESSPESGPSGE